MSGIQMILAAGAGAVTIPAELGTQYTYSIGSAPITCSICKTNDPAKFIIAYKEFSSREIKAQVLTVSGTAISFGSPFTVGNPSNSGRQNPSIVWDSTYNKAYVILTESNQSYYLGIYVLTMSGTSLSKGSLQVIETDSNFTVPESVGQSIWYNTAQSRWMVYYKNNTNSLRARTFTSNGTTLTFSAQQNLGLPASVSTWSIYHVDSVNTTYVGLPGYDGESGYYSYRLATITLSGTTFSANGPFTLNGRIGNYSELQCMIYQPSTNQLFNFYREDSGNVQKVVAMAPTFGGFNLGSAVTMVVSPAAPLEGIYDEFSGNPMALAIRFDGSYNQYLLQFRASGNVVTQQLNLANFNPSYAAFGQTCYAADTVNNRTIIAYGSVPGGGAGELYVRSIRGQKN